MTKRAVVLKVSGLHPSDCSDAALELKFALVQQMDFCSDNYLAAVQLEIKELNSPYDIRAHQMGYTVHWKVITTVHDPTFELAKQWISVLRISDSINAVGFHVPALHRALPPAALVALLDRCPKPEWHFWLRGAERPKSKTK